MGVEHVRPEAMVPTVQALVTGGAGFIGSQVVDGLVAAGHEVVVVDDLSTGRPENVPPGVDLIEADVTDSAGIDRAFAMTRPNLVFHLAAQIDVRGSVADPAFDAGVNVVGTATVLEAARVAGAGRFVFASTGGGLYGEADALPTTEDAPLRPLSPYGVGKAAAESYVRFFTREEGMSTISLRMANVYGPRQNPHGEAGVIALFCGAKLDARRPTLFGDGLQTRDFLYVDDAVAALLLAAVSRASGSFNVGTGRETALLDLVQKLGLEATFEPARHGEVRRSCLDASHAQRTLGWQPVVDLDEGLTRTVAAADQRGAIRSSPGTTR